MEILIWDEALLSTLTQLSRHWALCSCRYHFKVFDFLPPWVKPNVLNLGANALIIMPTICLLVSNSVAAKTTFVNLKLKVHWILLCFFQMKHWYHRFAFRYVQIHQTSVHFNGLNWKLILHYDLDHVYRFPWNLSMTTRLAKVLTNGLHPGTSFRLRRPVIRGRIYS